MAETTGISWADATFNPWIGCAKVGPGCDNCYADALMGEGGRYKRAAWGGPGAGVGTRTRTSEANWKLPRRWDRAAAKAGTRPFVFCSSLADVFDNAVPAEWRLDLFRLIDETPNLVWLLLTKRPGNIVSLSMPWTAHYGWPKNAAIGCTVVNQAEANRDVPTLLAAKAGLRPAFAFLSMEPLLGPVDLRTIVLRRDGALPTPLSSRLGDYIQPLRGNFRDSPVVDWVIAGGESGSNARPMHPQWPQSLQEQCADAGTAFHFKQWGEFVPADLADPKALLVEPWGEGPMPECFSGPPPCPMRRVGKARAGRALYLASPDLIYDARPVVPALETL